MKRVTDRASMSGVFDGTRLQRGGRGPRARPDPRRGDEPERVGAPGCGAAVVFTRGRRIDMLGHGASRLPAAHRASTNTRDSSAALLDALEIDAAHVVGHSMGALVALEFALTLSAASAERRCAERRVLTARRRSGPRSMAARGVARQAAALEQAEHRRHGRALVRRSRAGPSRAGGANSCGRCWRPSNPVGYARTYRLFASSDAGACRPSCRNLPCPRCS